MVSLSLHDVHLSYDASTVAVAGLDLRVDDGEFLVLLGPSGCGKTTTLRLIAGLETPDRGDVRFDDVSMISTPPEKRRVAMVFQSPALFPFRTVAENVAFGLKLQGVPKAERAGRVDEALSLVHVADLAQRWPAELSGGQRQRAALARALSIKPGLLLLDEPLSSLDHELRAELQQTILDIQRATNLTTVMVTHDRSEAGLMADRIAWMQSGAIVQPDTVPTPTVHNPTVPTPTARAL